ncbi:hypothetical protein AB0N62_41730 [Streptomyces sp. NPDC093982]|uniref:hypothetical protein n=1 Tax=Streptomyces sp. NPDC093982 TaxID=3155077 RepID=UPI003424A468
MVVDHQRGGLLTIIFVVRLRPPLALPEPFDEKTTVVLRVRPGALIAPTAFSPPSSWKACCRLPTTARSCPA